MKTKKSQTNHLQWLEDKLNKLDLTGRDELYTHLLTQEIPFWIHTKLKYGKTIDKKEVNFLIRNRGFNKEEVVKFRRLVRLLNANSRKIVVSFKDCKLSLKDFLKEIQSNLTHYEDKKLFKEEWLDLVKSNVRQYATSG